jgi:hypothetical protein
MKMLLMLVAVAALSVPSMAQTVTYCKNSSVLAINETFGICSPACANYSMYREEICAAGCDPKNSSCAPLPFDRALLIVGIILFVVFIIWASRRVG